MEVELNYKENVLNALVEARNNFSGTQGAFAQQYGINKDVFNTLLNHGYKDGLLSDGKWISIGKKLGVSLSGRQWNIAKTDVFKRIEGEILFCKEHSKSRMFVDACEIGKTVTAKYLSRTLKNCFYIDASQCHGKHNFVRTLAQTIGVSDKGTYADILSDTKYSLQIMPKPIVIIDEAGDLDVSSFLTLKELWNGTEGSCGWYMMGADGLRAKIERGITYKKVGFAEVFSRFSSKFSNIVPLGNDDKKAFYKNLITNVLNANCNNQDVINEIVKKCLVNKEGHIGGLRRAESLLILSSRNDG